jgi:hypothetical protein
MAGIRAWLAMATVLLTGAVSAQISVDLKLSQSVYILGEAIRADVEIGNQANVPFQIGAGRLNGLTFRIVDARKDLLETSQPKEHLIEALSLPGGAKHRAAFDLDEWYPLGRTGRFLVTAQVRRDDRLYESATRAMDIVPGLEIKSAIQLFADRPDAQRKLSLVYFMRKQAEFLFLRVTDTPGDRTWTTLELGQLLRTTPPTLEVTADGMVSIVHRATQDVYLKTRVQSTATGVELLGQEQVLDKVSAKAFTSEQVRRFEESKKENSGSWWPFGASSEKSK